MIWFDHILTIALLGFTGIRLVDVVLAWRDGYAHAQWIMNWARAEVLQAEMMKEDV